MDERIKFFIGLDAHKESTSVAVCEATREPARFAGTIGPDVRVLLKLLAEAGDPAQVSVVYMVHRGPAWNTARASSRRPLPCGDAISASLLSTCTRC